MRFFREFPSTIGILQRSLCMPIAGWVVAFFVVFRSGAMRLRGELMLLGGFAV